MKAYGAFAGVYDLLMKDADYKRWYEYLIRMWKRYGQKPGLILDLGCGTGNVSVMLAENGYEVIGVDGSAEMLAEAAGKAMEKQLEVLFLNQRIQSFELYGTVDCVISFVDSINYIIKKDELLQAFGLVKNYLNPGGLFIFDVNSPYKYKRVLASNTFAENAKGCSYIWENFYDEKSKLNEYALTLFIRNQCGLYQKHTEYHYQRAYSQRELKTLLKRAGLNVLGVYKAFTFSKADGRTDRIFYICGNEVNK